mgnify:CR=1 FL=1
MVVRITNNITIAINQLNGNVFRSLSAVGEFAKAEAQDRTPVDTGYLKSQNDYDVNLEKSKVAIGNTAEYAPPVELGTSKMEAQPFLVPAVSDNIETIKSLVARYLQEGM